MIYIVRDLKRVLFIRWKSMLYFVRIEKVCFISYVSQKVCFLEYES